MKFNQRTNLSLGVRFGAGLALAVIGAAKAEDVQLLKVTTDATQGEVFMQLETDSQNAIQALRYETSQANRERFPVNNLSSGVVIVRAQGKDVVTLVAEPNFSPESGGQVMIHYLRDGLAGKRGQFPVQILADAQGQWQVYSADPAQAPRLIDHLFFKRKRNFLGITVGIDRIEIR